MKKYLTLIIIACIWTVGHSQESINNYKYVIIPESFSFLGEEDQYQLNSLTKFLFNKYGYNALMRNEEFPQDLKDDKCLGMTAVIESPRSALKTKVQILLKDCMGNLIEASRIGETKVKEYDKAYNLALRDAFETFQNIDYKYQPKKKETTPAIKEKLPTPAEVNSKEEGKHAETKRLVEAVNDEIEGVEVEDDFARGAAVNTTSSKIGTGSGPAWYAQPIENGYQIVDTEPQRVMVIYNTGLENVFVVQGKDAIVFKKDGKWMYSEYSGSVKTKEVNIKF